MAEDECNREFDRYESERRDLRQAELDAERNYDQTISALAALALGVSLTIFKDFINTSAAVAMPLMVLTWVVFAVALVISLYHRKLTYETHRAWRDLLDKEFKNWSPGAWDRAEKAYDTIPGIKHVERLKGVGYGLLIFGSVLLTTFIIANSFNRESDNGNTEKSAATTAADTAAVPSDSHAGRSHSTASPASRPTEGSSEPTHDDRSSKIKAAVLKVKGFEEQAYANVRCF